MKIEVNKKVKSPLSEKKIVAILKKAMKNKKWEVSLGVVGPAAIKKFNQSYRKKNKSTDVLSFKYESYQGEIVICPSYVNHDKQKMARMIIHGALHLQGYDHKTRTGEEKMRKQEDKILNHVKF